MYSTILFAHSWLRWCVLILLIIVLVKFAISYFKQKNYTKLDRIFSSALLGIVHLQFLLGMVLYFGLSPIVQSAFIDVKSTMKNVVLRYWTVEHFAGMIVFTVLVQVGFSLSKRASMHSKKFKLMLIYCGVAFMLLLAIIPWPIYQYGRSLFRSSFSNF